MRYSDFAGCLSAAHYRVIRLEVACTSSIVAYAPIWCEINAHGADGCAGNDAVLLCGIIFVGQMVLLTAPITSSQSLELAVSLRITWLLPVVLTVSLACNAYLVWRIYWQLPSPMREQSRSSQPVTPTVGERGAELTGSRVAPLVRSRTQPITSANAVPVNDAGVAEPCGRHAMALFEQRQFVEAVRELALCASRDLAASAPLRQAWHARAAEWLERDQMEPFAAFIAAYLHQNPHDRDFLQLKAEWHVVRSELAEAIAQYYELVRETGDEAMRNADRKRVRELALNRASQLAADQAWQALQLFMRDPLWHEPAHPPYLLVAAQAALSLGELAQAEQYLDDVRDDYYAAQVEDMRAGIALARLRDIAVPLQTSGEHYIVRGQLDQRYPLKLLIDTGASLSVLSRRRFEALRDRSDWQFIRQLRVNTAGGMVDAPLYRVDEFAIGDYRVAPMEFVVIELENMRDTDGLLGMNFLGQFSFRIDQKNRLLLLSARAR